MYKRVQSSFFVFVMTHIAAFINIIYIGGWNNHMPIQWNSKLTFHSTDVIRFTFRPLNSRSIRQLEIGTEPFAPLNIVTCPSEPQARTASVGWKRLLQYPDICGWDLLISLNRRSVGEKSEENRQKLCCRKDNWNQSYALQVATTSVVWWLRLIPSFLPSVLSYFQLKYKDICPANHPYSTLEPTTK